MRPNRVEVRIEELNRRFQIPGTVQVVAGNGGLPKVQITCPEAVGEMYLHGAHVTSWKPEGREEVLFLSSESRWEEEHAIRGGIPICFPWFGDKSDDPKAPAHGFVRAEAWQLESVAKVRNAITVTMFTENDDSTQRWWPAEFRLVHRVTFGSELTLELVVTNTGRTVLRFEEALHAYYQIGDIQKVRVHGLGTVHYLDKTDSNRMKLQQGAIEIVSETDRVYLNTTDVVELEDPALHRRTRVTKENSRTTVVWNPWLRKAHSLSDLADDEWMRMLCIETSNVSDFAVDLGPGEQHKMKAAVAVREQA
jgi:glucose-6-phosphate 1-epimerase